MKTKIRKTGGDNQKVKPYSADGIGLKGTRQIYFSLPRISKNRASDSMPR